MEHDSCRTHLCSTHLCRRRFTYSWHTQPATDTRLHCGKLQHQTSLPTTANKECHLTDIYKSKVKTSANGSTIQHQYPTRRPLIWELSIILIRNSRLRPPFRITSAKEKECSTVYLKPVCMEKMAWILPPISTSYKLMVLQHSHMAWTFFYPRQRTLSHSNELSKRCWNNYSQYLTKSQTLVSMSSLDCSLVLFTDDPSPCLNQLHHNSIEYQIAQRQLIMKGDSEDSAKSEPYLQNTIYLCFRPLGASI